MAKDEPDFISSDRTPAGHHMAQGMAENGSAQAPLRHPSSLVALAYGLTKK